MAGTITHSWKGTVLTIQSDSGISSMDLAGATGCRGPQGQPGVVYDNEGKILVAGMASMDYVNAELAKYDNKTLIRDEDGNLMTAVGGHIIEKVESVLIDSAENAVRSYVSLPNGLYTIIISAEKISEESAPPLIDVSLLTEDVGYDVCLTLNNGAEVEFKDVVYHAKGTDTPLVNNEYATSAAFLPNAFMIYTYNIDFWRDVDTSIPLFEVKTHGFCIYEPINGQAIPLDDDTLVYDEKLGIIKVGKNYATQAYVDNAIANADIGGGGSGGGGGTVTVDLSNYYTKDETYSRTEVRSLIIQEIAKIASSEGVEY